MRYYQVTVQIFKDDTFDCFETHYATGESGGENAAANSVKSHLNRTLPSKYPGSRVAMVVAPGGVIEITKTHYDNQFKSK